MTLTKEQAIHATLAWLTTNGEEGSIIRPTDIAWRDSNLNVEVGHDEVIVTGWEGAFRAPLDDDGEIAWECWEIADDPKCKCGDTVPIEYRKHCNQCGAVMCAWCYKEHHGCCDEVCFQKQERGEAADCYYDRMKEG